MTIDHFRQLVSTVRFPITIVTRKRQYVVDRRDGVRTLPGSVLVVRNEFDVVVPVASIREVLGHGLVDEHDTTDEDLADADREHQDRQYRG